MTNIKDMKKINWYIIISVASISLLIGQGIEKIGTVSQASEFTFVDLVKVGIYLIFIWLLGFMSGLEIKDND